MWLYLKQMSSARPMPGQDENDGPRISAYGTPKTTSPSQLDGIDEAQALCFEVELEVDLPQPDVRFLLS